MAAFTHPIDSRRATCDDCGFKGSLAALELHSCDIQEQGGRCEDYPCCGHTDGDGCQTRPEHTADFYYRNPQFLHEPGSPEWYDAMDDGSNDEDYDDDEDPDRDESYCQYCYKSSCEGECFNDE